MNPYKKYNPDPQSWDDEPEIPEIDDADDFDPETDYDDHQEQLIMMHGINADSNNFY